MGQIAAAMFVLVAVLAVFIYPLTFGLPAPQQKQSPLWARLALALAAIVTLIASAFAVLGREQTATISCTDPTHRLALICTRLC